MVVLPSAQQVGLHTAHAISLSALSSSNFTVYWNLPISAPRLLDMSCCATGSLTPVRDSRRYESFSVTALLKLRGGSSMLTEWLSCYSRSRGRTPASRSPPRRSRSPRSASRSPVRRRSRSRSADYSRDWRVCTDESVRMASRTPPTFTHLTGHSVAEKAGTPD